LRARLWLRHRSSLYLMQAHGSRDLVPYKQLFLELNLLDSCLACKVDCDDLLFFRGVFWFDLLVFKLSFVFRSSCWLFMFGRFLWLNLIFLGITFRLGLFFRHRCVFFFNLNFFNLNRLLNCNSHRRWFDLAFLRFRILNLVFLLVFLFVFFLFDRLILHFDLLLIHNMILCCLLFERFRRGGLLDFDYLRLLFLNDHLGGSYFLLLFEW